MYFKQVLHIVVFTFFALNSFASGDGHEIAFTAGNIAYEKGDFVKAIEHYEKLEIHTSFGSENTKFNLANAYFKNGEIGKSILYYEKVLKQNPNNKDAAKNLAYVKTKLENDLNELPDLFFVAWWKQFIHFFKADTWAWISVCFFWFALIAFAFYLFFTNITFRKAAFIKTIIFSFIALLSLFITKIKTGEIFNATKVVLIKENTVSKSAPSLNSENASTFYEGSKFKIEDQVDVFYKVKSLEGNFVWVKKEDFREI